MTIPNLKRVSIGSELELRTWLKNHPDYVGRIMCVTKADSTHSKYVSSDEIQTTIGDFNWFGERRYTLNGNQIGHVIRSPSE